MAEVQPTQADPVAGLIDIPLPQQVSLLPQTWESRVAIALLLAALILIVWRITHQRRVNRYRREALLELNRLSRAGLAARPELLGRLSLLVRRTALATFPRERVASLVGPAWLSFLDQSYGGVEFSQGVGRLLANGPYQQTPFDDAELQSLVWLIRRWIKVHHV